MTHDTKLRGGFPLAEIANEALVRMKLGVDIDSAYICGARHGWDAKAKHEDERVRQLKGDHKRLLEAHGRVLVENVKVRRLMDACKELIETRPDVYGEGSFDRIIEALKEFGND